MNRLLAFACLALLLAASGCAAGATAAGMTVTKAELVAPANAATRAAYRLGAVGGGEETNPLWTSQVGSNEFKEALVASLRAAGLLGDGQARYELKAMLVELKQPFIGLDMTVTATVQYAVTDTTTGQVVLSEKVVTPHTATMGDAFVGATRLKLANEGAVRKNIAEVVKKLGAAQLPGQLGVN
jgi:hypothetical protein